MNDRSPPRRRAGAAMVLLLSPLTGCPTEPPPPPPAAEPPAPDRDPRCSRAQAAAQALGGRLRVRLQEGLATGGPAAGIAACRSAAPEIAPAVSAELGVRMGRTSFKLRNPANAPPDWAQAWVAERTTQPRFARAADGTLQALLPIFMEPLCVTCHGPADGLSAEVRAALTADYPEDQATGFQPGEVRGWFWVEVP